MTCLNHFELTVILYRALSFMDLILVSLTYQKIHFSSSKYKILKEIEWQIQIYVMLHLFQKTNKLNHFACFDIETINNGSY